MTNHIEMVDGPKSEKCNEHSCQDVVCQIVIGDDIKTPWRSLTKRDGAPARDDGPRLVQVGVGEDFWYWQAYGGDVLCRKEGGVKVEGNYDFSYLKNKVCRY